MSAETDQQPGAAPAEEPQEPLAGKRLAEARREQQISIDEIAKELHLDEAKVRALEGNNFEKLGAAVYAKGHLRKYAELVGIDVDDVLTDYYKMTRSEQVPPLVFDRPRARRELSPGPWIAIVIIVVFLAALYWWLVEREPGVVPTLPESSVEEPAAAADEPEPGETPVTLTTDDADPEAVRPAAGAESESLQAAGPSESTSAAATADAGSAPAPSTANVDDAGVADIPEAAEATELRLTISFTGDCWTEISDAEGRRMYFGMGRDGQTVDLVGVTPVSALFGNAANVALFVDGAEYPLPSDAPNQTIRLTLFEPD